MTDFALARRNMIEGQLRPNRVNNAILLAAIAELPRERFLPDGLSAIRLCGRRRAAGQRSLPVEPMVLARLSRHCSRAEDRALVVASGCGYGAAMMARLTKTVVAVESDDRLAGTAEKAFQALEFTNIQLMIGRLDDGARELGPYNVILVEGAVRQFRKPCSINWPKGGAWPRSWRDARRAGKRYAHGEAGGSDIRSIAIRCRHALIAGVRATGSLYFLGMTDRSEANRGLSMAIHPVIMSNLI